MAMGPPKILPALMLKCKSANNSTTAAWTAAWTAVSMTVSTSGATTAADDDKQLPIFCFVFKK